jgi:hypothetical protein
METIKRALVIGNADYGNAKANLENPINDANSMTALLRVLDFEVVSGLNLDTAQTQQLWRSFLGGLRPPGPGARKVVAVIYFAGHGVQLRGENYLIPVREAIGSEGDLRDKALAINAMLQHIGRNSDVCIAFLDCCRDNPFAATESVDDALKAVASSRGLAAPEVKTDGFFISFATAPNARAADGAGDGSPYAKAIAAHILRKNTTIFNMMLDVRRKVREMTGGLQSPWDQSSLVEHFGFAFDDDFDPGNLPSREELARQREIEFRELIRQTDSPDLVRSFIAQFPNSTYRAEAEAQLDRLVVARWRSKMLQRAAQVMLGALALFTAWFAAMWLSFSTMGGQLNQADLYGGDIVLPTRGGKRWQDHTQWRCQTACILSRFSHCIGYTWDSKNRVCYLKREIPYFYSGMEFHNQLFSKYAVFSDSPAKTELNIIFDRLLYGTEIPPAQVSDGRAFRLTLGNSTYVTRAEEKPRWTATRTECEERCNVLGPKVCEGFTYSPIRRECFLFGDVDGVVKYPPSQPAVGARSQYVLVGGLFSACRQKAKDGADLTKCERTTPRVVPFVPQALPVDASRGSIREPTVGLPAGKVQ